MGVGVMGGGASAGESFDMSLIPDEEMGEFEDVCRVIARDVEAAKNRSQEDDDEDDEDDDDDDDDEEDDEDDEDDDEDDDDEDEEPQQWRDMKALRGLI
jgi:hypothetical protein